MQTLLPSRPGLLAAVLFGVVTLTGRRARCASMRLTVYLHLPLKQRALQKSLESALPGVAVTAVGRLADLERALAAGQDAVVSLPVVLAAKGLSPKLRGYRAGAPDEKYALVGTGAAPEPTRLATVGALDLLGRTQTTTFVHDLLGAHPKVVRVTKVEDLLALLQMQRADAILLPLRLVSEIKGMTRLTLVHTELAPRVGLPAACSVGPAGPQVLSAIARLPSATSHILGVDEWR